MAAPANAPKKLPEELILHVIRQLRCERSELVSFSQVAKGYFAPCQKYLLEEVDLSHKDDTLVEHKFNCIEKVVKRCGVGMEQMLQGARVLRVSFGWGEPQGVLSNPAFIHFLRSFTSLESLTLARIDFDGSQDSLLVETIMRLISLPGIQSVKLWRLERIPAPLMKLATQVPSLTMETSSPGSFRDGNIRGFSKAGPHPIMHTFNWSGGMPGDGIVPHHIHARSFSAVRSLGLFLVFSSFGRLDFGGLLDYAGDLEELNFMYPTATRYIGQMLMSATHDVLAAMGHPRTRQLLRLRIRFHTLDDPACSSSERPFHKYLWDLVEILKHSSISELLEELSFDIVVSTPIIHCAKRLQDDIGKASQAFLRLDEILSSRDKFPKLQTLRWCFVRDLYLDEIKFNIPVCQRIIQGATTSNMPMLNAEGRFALEFVSKVDSSWVWVTV
ncbi:hypothetical protein FA15DRAFT_668844, partial [Coprinopsis marcescibilis]